MELYRQQQEISWSEHFLDLQRQALLPVEFLSTWKRHKRIRETLYFYNDALPVVLDEVHADIFVNTRKIKVLSNDSMELEDRVANDVIENDAEEEENVSGDINESELKFEQNVRREDKDRLSFAPLTNRFATLTKEWRRRPLDKIGEEKVLFDANANRENEENDVRVQLLISCGCKRLGKQ